MDAHWLEHNKGVINHVQVYGLPRSGTNFAEWSLVHNFEGVEYANTYARNDVPSLDVEVTALKHTFPNLKRSQYALVMYKAWPDYTQSYHRWAGKDPNRVDYDTYIKLARALDPKRCIVIDHAWACNNYIPFLHRIADVFKLQLANKIVYPKNRLDRGGAHCKETDVKYIPSGDSK